MTTSDASRSDSVLDVAASGKYKVSYTIDDKVAKNILELMDNVRRDSGSRGCEWMTESNGSSVHVQFLHWDSEFTLHGKGLWGKGLVDLEMMSSHL